MSKSIRIHETGGPEVLKWEDVEVPAPGEGEIRVRHTAIGLNFIDIYQRSGLYPLELPLTLGVEAAGVVEEIGTGIDNFELGQRITYSGGQMGAYAEERTMNAAAAIALPDNIDDQTAAAMMLKGMTAHMLMFRVYPVNAGDTVLIHAASGGVGTIMCQWAKHLGATVIGTVGSDEKAEHAKAHGCDHPIVYTRENFTDRVLEITDGAKLPVVYDSIGKDTFEGSLDCLRNFGVLASFGNASGPIPDFSPLVLMQKGSLSLTRPTLFNHVGNRADLETAANALFEVVGGGQLKIEVNQTYPLKDVAQAHQDLAARKTTGSTVFIP